jgi:DNA primase
LGHSEGTPCSAFEHGGRIVYNSVMTISARLNFLKVAFNGIAGGSDGVNYAVKCPVCKNTEKRKLAIRIDNGKYKCWVCSTKGNNISTIIRKYKPAHYSESQRIFGSGKIVIEEEHVHVENVRLPYGFTLLASNLKNPDPDVRAVIKYAMSRGLTHADLWYFRLGTCASGKHRRRCIFPSFDGEGVLNYFVSRAIDDVLAMKYINSWTKKQLIIFNEINIDWTQELVLVEGPFDLTKCNQNATCLLGSALSKYSHLFQKIVENNTPVVLALDSDMQKKTHEFAKRLHSYGIGIKTMSLGEFNDVGEMSKEDFLKAKKMSSHWQPNDRLLFLIKNISSGSLL